MAELAGLSWIGASRGERGTRAFRAQDPVTGAFLEPPYSAASQPEVERACALAQEAVGPFGDSTPQARAALLEAVAAGLEDAAGPILARAGAETALPEARLRTELGRTCHQLRLFAELVAEGSWVDARIDRPDPERQPLPRPDVRSMRRPLGPVVVFGAGNFPLAFSVAGGDTASALAAGNPVVVKAHPSHPGTSELVGAVIAAAVERLGLPEGTFSLLFDDGLAAGQALVAHPLVAAVGFTGSRAGGEALMRLAAGRPRPIPVFAEMGSVNPVVVLPGAARERARALAEGLHGSFTLGVGQFCTNPGVVLLPAGADGDAVAAHLAELTRATPAGAMLAGRIATAYEAGTSRLAEHGATLLAEGLPGSSFAPGRAAVWQVEGAAALAEPRLLEEVFGPITLLVRWRDRGELARLAEALEGNLTASLHARPEELGEALPLVRSLERRVGRLVFNQLPTGVEVNHAMVHGGPFPASSDGRSTSVGSRAIERFTRLVAYQGWPQEALPAELQDANPRGIRRQVDGVWTGG